MAEILNFIALNITLNEISTSSNFLEAVQNYLGENTGVGLLSNYLDSWNQINFPFPIVMKSFDSNINMLPITAYIIDSRYDTISSMHLKLIFRNADTKFVFVTSNDNIEATTKSIRELYLCHALLIKLNTEESEILKLEDRCIGLNTPDLQTVGCKVNVSFMDFPPNVIFTGHSLTGFEGMMFQTVADHIGLDINFINRHEKEWGQFDPPEGLHGDVGTGRSLASFGALYAYQWRWANADLLFGCNNVHLAWAVAVGSGPSHPTWFIILVSEFSFTVWLCIFATYLLSNVTSYILNCNSKSNTNWPIHNLALILGTSQTLIQPKPITIAIVFFGLIITSYYQTIMASKLTRPAKIPEIDDLDTLSKAGMLLYGPPSAWPALTASAVIAGPGSGKDFINKNFVPTLADLDELLPRIVDKKEVAYLRHSANLLYQVQQNPKYAGTVHMVKEDSLEFVPITMIRKHSCLTRKLQMGYTRLCDSGLGRKWYKDMTAERPKWIDRGPKKLAFQHIKGFLILLSVGLMVASAIFIAEIIIFNIKKTYKEKTAKQNEKLPFVIKIKFLE